MIKLIIFDFNRTLFNVEKNKLIPECIHMLERLSKRYNLVIVSTKQKQRDLLVQKMLGNSITIKTEIVQEKSTENVLEIILGFKVRPSETLIVGDYLKEEIFIGNKISATTVWFKNGIFSELRPTNEFEKPDFVLNELDYKSLMNVLKQLN